MRTAKSRTQTALSVSVLSILINLALAALKLVVGVLAGSVALISDAAHSASDVFSTVIVIIGLKLSCKEADADHEYGHDRLECIAAAGLAIVLAVTGACIGWNGIKTILFGTSELAVPGLLAAVAAALSIAVKEAMYWATRRAAKSIGSSSLMADAWHHRSDALSSVGSLIGILGARLGFPILDPLASIVIALLVLRAAWQIFQDAISKLTDRSAGQDLEQALAAAARSVDGVLDVDLLRTRQFGSGYYVDIEIQADGALPLTAAHSIAQSVHDHVETAFPDVKHCMVHVNPAG